MESDHHRDQITALLNAIKWWWRHRSDFYATGNLTFYYNPEQKTTRDVRGPDFFVVLGVDKRDRKSWMVWNENNRYPNLIIELLSSITAQVDRTTKKELYQNQFQTPEYFWFDPAVPEEPDTPQEFEGFRLIGGNYEAIPRTEEGWMWSEELELYLGINEYQLRFFTPEGELVPTEAEYERQAKEQERQRAEQAEQRAEQAQHEMEQLRQRLRDWGLDLDK